MGVHQPGLVWNPYTTLTITDYTIDEEFESAILPPPSWIKNFVEGLIKGAALCRGVLGVPFAPEINQLRHVSEVIGRRQRKREFQGTFSQDGTGARSKSLTRRSPEPHCKGDERFEVIWADGKKVSNEALYEGLKANGVLR